MKLRTMFEILAALYPVYFLLLLILLVRAFKRSYSVFPGFFRDLRRFDILVLVMLITLGAFFRIRHSIHLDLDPYGWGYIKDAFEIKNFFFLDFKSYSLADAFHPPGYPFLIFPLLFFSGDSLWLISAFNLVLSLLTIALVYSIAFLLTKDRAACMVSSVLLVFSGHHIFYSAYEFPFPASVFLVVLEFLCLMLWLENKNRALGIMFVLFFFISLNVKIENIVFLPVFAIAVWQRWKAAKDAAEIRIQLKYIFLVGVLSVFMLLCFVYNLKEAQAFCIPPRYSLFGLENFWRHFYNLIIVKFRAMPVWIVTAYLILVVFRRPVKNWHILIGWFFCGLSLFFYAQYIDAKWNMAQVLVPVFLMAGLVISRTFDMFFKNTILKNSLFLLLFFVLFSRSLPFRDTQPRLSWIEIKKELSGLPEGGCILAPAFLTSEFSLKFLFPGKRWIFFRPEDELGNKTAGCNDTFYYFNPLPYGFGGAPERFKYTFAFEKKLKEAYEFSKVGQLELYLCHERT